MSIFSRSTKILILGGLIVLNMNSCKDDDFLKAPFVDTDGDGIENGKDNCPCIANFDQADLDGDGAESGNLCDVEDKGGDVCDNDIDGDGVADDIDNCPMVANPNQEDGDDNDIGDLCTRLEICETGFAGIYPCSDYDLMAYMSLDDLMGPGVSGNDCWGWVDPDTQKEYALVGTSTGVAFVDITNPTALVVVGTLPTAATGDASSTWRDIKVYNNHAYIVADLIGNHGMQVFDLTRLRDVITAPETFTEDFHYTDFGSAHNIVINESTGYAFPVGVSGVFLGGPLFLNIQDPINPIDEGGFPGYSHDAQVVTYTGPDMDYIGQEILIGSNEDEVVIVNISDKEAPVLISSFTYDNIGYTHQGWFTENMTYFLLGDEHDESNFGGNTRTVVIDLTDLDNPILHTEYVGTTAAIDHNGYVNGDLFYMASYTAGVRVLDISSISSKIITESGFFDTHPESDNTAFNGVWSVYPYLPSGNIIVSDIEKGLFVIRKSGT